ncbi:hypothetical protein B0O99DRAFT_688586 [Bisporella sp. PMI_857]|nr:hypothetical protein B0O99DRAFT_688586 [Bisporella sp. PMI_857]
MATHDGYQRTFDPSAVSGISASFDPSVEFDDTAFGGSLVNEEPLFSADWNQDTPPYDGGLYSTPLNWDPPKPAEATHTKIEAVSPKPYVVMNNSVLTAAQQEKLASIAMPTHLQYRGQHSPNSNASRKSASVSSPESQGRKRKSSAELDDEDDEDSPGHQHPVKKTAHNMIEKRYRTNLNDKIAALRDSVPSLRIMSKSARGEDTNDDREDLQGLTPAHKLNKATVLSKATEYIHHLEKRNKRLQEENAYMKGRIDAFEKLFMAGSLGLNPAPQYSQPFAYPQEFVDTPGPSPIGEPQGMIQVPEDIRRLRTQAGQQQAFAVPQEPYQQGRQPIGPNGWQQNGGGYFGRLMVGSLAGLMILEGFSEAEQDSEGSNARGLFAFPTQLVSTASRSFHSSMEFSVSGYHISASRTLGYLKTFFVLGALLYVFLPSLFRSKTKPTDKKAHGASLTAVPSLASSIEVRRKAWLTAIQTVWVPNHNFFLEAAALCLKMLKLSARNVMGAQAFTYLTGITEQQEAARIKAWEIALDAQLAGGDEELSKSRLTLTLLASGTLPDTPARLMLKALHIRVLLWEVGNSGFSKFYMFQETAAKLARWKWNEARQLQRLLTCAKEPQAEELPEYLVALLDQECDDVLVDSIGQRAYNLAWNKTEKSSTSAIDSMDGVVEDFAIRSPLDAVAAWWSSLVLQRALARSLEARDNGIAQKTIIDDIALAIKTAPIGSGAQIRALVTRAVLVKEKRGASIAAALKVFGPSESRSEKANSVPTLINTASSFASMPDIEMSLRCAMAIAHLDRYPPPANPTTSHRLINGIIPTDLTPLGFTSCFKLMERINDHEMVSTTCSRALEQLAGSLRIWIGSKNGEQSGLKREIKKEMVARCLEITKRIVGMKDAGYESMSEDDNGEGC